jgi:hypothetical protein
LYALLAGLLFLVFAEDVKRYKAPIRTMAAWCLFAIFSFGMYVSSHLSYVVTQWFFWFIVADATYSLLFVVAILVLQSRIGDSGSSKHDETSIGREQG